jgi:hypothetical protein
MVQALAIFLTMALAGGGADYTRAIDCAAGEATLAALLGGDHAQGADRDTVDRLGALSDRWLRAALASAGKPTGARNDLARSKAALAANLAAARDPAGLSATLDAHLAGCAAPMDTGTVGS